MKIQCEVEHRNDVTLDIMVQIRQTAHFNGKYGAPDELLLHSGGPKNDLAQRSLLMGPTTRRYIVRQQPRESEIVHGSPLRGEINLQSNPAPIEISVENWDEGWTHQEIIQGADLANGLRQLAEHLPPHQGEHFQAGGLAGLLTYDMVQHTEPLRLEHLPEDDSILMILYRADRWIIHDHMESIIEIHSAINNDQWVEEIEHLLEQGIPIRPTPAPPRARVPATESDALHAEKVRKTQAAIREGVLYQLNYGLSLIHI